MHHEIRPQWRGILVIAKPKPTKADRPPKKAKLPPRRKIVEAQLKEMVKAIISWRDGQECVEKNIDGARCGRGLMWGHFITQHASPWLRYSLSNVFWQCGNHNFLHDKDDVTYRVWFSRTFGNVARDMLEHEAALHIGIKPKLHELESMIEHYTNLFENRPYLLWDLSDFVRNGYYGEIIKAAWREEGRL